MSNRKRLLIGVALVVGLLVVLSAGTLVALQQTREGYKDIVVTNPDAEVHVGDVIHSQQQYGGFFNIGVHLTSWVARQGDNNTIVLVHIPDVATWQQCINRPGARQLRVDQNWIHAHEKIDSQDMATGC